MHRVLQEEGKADGSVFWVVDEEDRVHRVEEQLWTWHVEMLRDPETGDVLREGLALS